MASENTSNRHLASPLARRVGVDATAEQVAQAFGALWLEIVVALCPIIGAQGVAALGRRSLHLLAADAPWLAVGQPAQPAKFDPSLLLPLLAQRSSAEAAAAVGQFLDNFHDMLSKLIGASLTERLLRAVWGSPQAPVSNSPSA